MHLSNIQHLFIWNAKTSPPHICKRENAEQGSSLEAIMISSNLETKESQWLSKINFQVRDWSDSQSDSKILRGSKDIRGLLRLRPGMSASDQLWASKEPPSSLNSFYLLPLCWDVGWLEAGKDWLAGSRCAGTGSLFSITGMVRNRAR